MDSIAKHYKSGSGLHAASSTMVPSSNTGQPIGLGLAGRVPNVALIDHKTPSP
jgi:hypothetical protein